MAALGLPDQPPVVHNPQRAQTTGGRPGARDGTQREIRIALIGQSDYAYRCHEAPSSWSGGLAIELARARIASPSLVLILLERLQSLPLLSPQATKKRSHTLPTMPGAMADCAFSRQCSHVFPSLSVCTSCTAYCALSRTRQLWTLSYSVSVNVVNLFSLLPACINVEIHLP